MLEPDSRVFVGKRKGKCGGKTKLCFAPVERAKKNGNEGCHTFFKEKKKLGLLKYSAISKRF